MAAARPGIYPSRELVSAWCRYQTIMLLPLRGNSSTRRVRPQTIPASRRPGCRRLQQRCCPRSASAATGARLGRRPLAGERLQYGDVRRLSCSPADRAATAVQHRWRPGRLRPPPRHELVTGDVDDGGGCELRGPGQGRTGQLRRRAARQSRVGHRTAHGTSQPRTAPPGGPPQCPAPGPGAAQMRRMPHAGRATSGRV